MMQIGLPADQRRLSPRAGGQRQTGPVIPHHRAWRRGGMRLADDGATCIYDVPRPSKVRRIGKRSVVIVEAGDEDGGMVEVE